MGSGASWTWWISINAARHLVAAGQADGRRLGIRGGSAGGYTVLAALTRHPEVFAAGASYYGISDLEALLVDSHKFEARCLDILVGPYPATRDEYRRRSPIHARGSAVVSAHPVPGARGQGGSAEPVRDDGRCAAPRRACPSPTWRSRASSTASASAENIIRSLEAELWFYGAVFGFTPADRIEPPPIDNAEKLPKQGSF